MVPGVSLGNMNALQRVVASNGVVIYRSEILRAAGFIHGFSTRTGGVSVSPFDSMNLGVAQAPGIADSDANIAHNAQRLMEAVGAHDAVLMRVLQVHGNTVYVCDGSEQFGPPKFEADAVVSADRRVAACIRTADCVPILIGCPKTGAVCAIHAGWRGIVAGVIDRAVMVLVDRLKSDAGSLLAAIGPCIGRNIYEVGAQVAGEFAGVCGQEFVLPVDGQRQKEHIDCFGAVRSQLLGCGLQHEHIDGTELCTASISDDFFSYRRDGARSGRMAAVVLPV